MDSLKPNGILAFFEPNSFFLPRHFILNTSLKKHVYFDDEEKPINYIEIRKSMGNLGMKEVYTRFVQPPYNRKFLKRLKFWVFYYLVVKILYNLDRHFLLPLANLIFGKSTDCWF